MHYKIILKILGTLLMLYSISMLPPALVSSYFSDREALSFIFAFLINFSIGLVIWFPVHKYKSELRNRDGFLVVVLFWTVLGLSGSLPFIISHQVHMSVTDAVFESISGLTTTGATVLTHLDTLPKSILFYRQQLQWFGGLGIIVLAVAILPMLGIGGMQLYRAETPGPMKDSKLTPRITETAKALWYIYLVLTVASGLAYWAAGMSGFDAICHAFSTISIGGFSTHDASIGYYNSISIDLICCIFMLLASINFTLHFVAWRSFSVIAYFKDPELKTYLCILFIIWFICTLGLLQANQYDTLITTLRNSLFQTISVSSTTGFTTSNFGEWPMLSAIIILLGSCLGGCAGSTCGGIKVIRILLVFKQVQREIKRLIYPSATIPVKIGNKGVSERIIEAVWGFIGAYACVFIVCLLALLANQVDLITSFSAVLASLNNLGPGLGKVAVNYSGLNDMSKWVLCFAMLMGRLEVFTLLILFNPLFWRR